MHGCAWVCAVCDVTVVRTRVLSGRRPCFRAGAAVDSPVAPPGRGSSGVSAVGSGADGRPPAAARTRCGPGEAPAWRRPPAPGAPLRLSPGRRVCLRRGWLGAAPAPCGLATSPGGWATPGRGGGPGAGAERPRMGPAAAGRGAGEKRSPEGP